MRVAVVRWVTSLSPTDVLNSYTSTKLCGMAFCEGIAFFLFNVNIIFFSYELWFYVNYLSDTEIWKNTPHSDLPLG